MSMREVKKLQGVKMTEGRIIRSYSDWFDVLTPHGVFACQLRGRFRRIGRPLTGDWVSITAHDHETGVIEQIHERKNQLHRPPVANVDQAVLVMSLVQPDLNVMLLDRSLVLVEHEGLDSLICFSKTDLVPEDVVRNVVALYSQAGYRTLPVSTRTEAGIDTLHEHLMGKTSVFAGPSGAGKSSLLNAIHPGLRLAVATVSKSTGRGRHTTRKVELLKVSEDALVADTPGFSRLDMTFLTKWDVSQYFRELAERKDQCRFLDCLHRQEPGCAVKQAVEDGIIARSRYENYLILVTECEDIERRKYT